MASLAMLTGHMGSLTLGRSCRPAQMGRSNGTVLHTCMGQKGSYHVEVVVGDKEPEDAALRRFRRGVMNSNLLNEARRRKTFENTQDVKKRKIKERGLWKKQKFRIETFDESAGEEPAPFADLFGEDDFFGEDVEELLSNGNRKRPAGGFRPRSGGQNEGSI